MQVINIIFNIITVFILIGLFNMIRYSFKLRKVLKENKNNPNMKGISIVNGEIKVIEDGPKATTEQEEIKDLVEDVICGKKVNKKEAYRVLRQGKEYFFCSWECRDKFVESQ